MMKNGSWLPHFQGRSRLVLTANLVIKMLQALENPLAESIRQN